ncbi:sentrin-specific protease 7 isoform X4, partial [Brachionus plicatilis]
NENKINITISTMDIKYAACIFYDPLYLILMHLNQQTVDMYKKSMKDLDGFDHNYPASYIANSRLVYMLNIEKNKLKDFSNMLSSYFSTIMAESCNQLNFIKQQKGKWLVYDTFKYCENKPEIVENFIKGFVPVTSKVLLKYPLTEQSNCSTIEINSVDFSCLKEGEFLNDNIISFYLKYLFNEIISPEDRKRTHIFDTFFYQKLTHTAETKSKEDTALNAAQRRYMRVKNWTRSVNIFEKDFLIIPINKNVHWYLAIVCYPYLKEPVYQENSKINAEREKKKDSLKHKLFKNSKETEFELIPDDLSSNDEAEAEDSKDGFVEDERICLKRPIILIFDSLPSTNKNKRVMATIRQYLECEWKSKYPNDEQEPTFLTKMMGTNVEVPLQTNYFDCGIYLLQYVESFFTKPVEKLNIPINLDTWFPLSMIKSKRSSIKKLIIKLRDNQKNIENSQLFLEKKSELNENQASVSKKPKQNEIDDEKPSKKVTNIIKENDKLNLNENSLKDKSKDESKLVKNGKKILSDLKFFDSI